MKHFLTLAIVALALAAVPVALGDTDPPPTIQTTPSGQTQAPGQGQGRQGEGQGQSQGGQGQNAAARIQMIRMRVRLIERRFATQCGTDKSNASQQCIEFAQKAEQRLGQLDTKLQELIAKRQQAGKDVTPLTRLDTAVQALAKKLHDWLGS